MKAMSIAVTSGLFDPPESAVRAARRDCRSLTADDVADAAARRPRWHLAFPPAIEDRFDSAIRSARIFHLRLLVPIGLLAYLAYSPIDSFTFPELGAGPFTLRCAVVVPLGVVLLMSVHLMSAALREAYAGTAMTIVMILTIGFVASARNEASAHGMFCALMVSMFGTVTLRLRFPWALAFTLLNLVAVVGLLAVRTDLPDGLRAIIAVSMTICALFGLVANWQLERAERKAFLATLFEQLKSEQLSQDALALSELVRIDPLTQLANRRAFDDRLADLQDERQAFSLLMIDVDFFKLYNDRYGHLAGDTCLQRVADILVASSARPGDLVARFGGEEFVVLLADCRAQEARWVADSIRLQIAEADIAHAGRGDGTEHVTVSVGVASAPERDRNAADAILQVADSRLYACKRAGRDRVLGEEAERRDRVA